MSALGALGDNAVVEGTRTVSDQTPGVVMQIFSRKLALATVALVITVAVPALAAQKIIQVEYINTTTPNLYLQGADGINYQATAGYSPCAAVNAPNIDTVKIWASLGQAALLSGKNATIYTGSCAGSSVHWITDVVLAQ
jgi:hypothetical protein